MRHFEHVLVFVPHELNLHFDFVQGRLKGGMVVYDLLNFLYRVTALLTHFKLRFLIFGLVFLNAIINYFGTSNLLNY